ncbi:MAG: SDR family NAD(P)-dependent oxidoreductase [Chthoniobacterales bacterium]|nr:SDR family NAD(P)-dependent oxidoreductase [Chthoniobacterales bacterium]
MSKVFLTGASSGIGLATAKALVERGHEVWGTSRDPGRLPALARLHPIRLDLGDRLSVTEAWEMAANEAEGIDVLINNAGSGHFSPAETLEDELRRQFQIVFFAHVQLCQLALRLMQSQGHGLIINTTSLASRLPVPFMAGYNSAKAAMASFTLTLQLELGESLVKLVDLQPADIRTAFNDVISTSEETRTNHQSRLGKAWQIVDRNLKKAPKPSLVAERIVKLLEDRNPPPRITVGDTFQTIIAPMLYSLLPSRARVWSVRRYYGI